MKKRFLAVVSLLVLTFSLTACGKFKCDLCGQEKTGSKHTVEVFGEKGTICGDCYKEMKELGSAFGF